MLIQAVGVCGSSYNTVIQTRPCYLLWDGYFRSFGKARSSEAEAQSKSVFGTCLTLQWMNDFGKQKQEAGSQVDIWILVSCVPGELQSRSAVELEDEDLSWNHKQSTCLDLQIVGRGEIVQLTRSIDIPEKALFEAYSPRMLKE